MFVKTVRGELCLSFGIILALWTGLIIKGEAKDFCVMGQTFEVIEEDFYEVIVRKLQASQASGEIKIHQEKLQRQVEQSVRTPKPVAGVQNTSTPRTFTYDPSIQISHDYKDHNGTVFAKAGTTVNPLKTVSLTKPLLFLDGDNKDHLAWARRQGDTAKWILTRGSPLEVEKEEGRVIYFDQEGRLVRKFGISQVPAIIVQEGDLLRIKEQLPEALS